MSEDDQYQLTDSGPENYERHRVPAVFGPLAERFLATVSLQDGDRVLDVALVGFRGHGSDEVKDPIFRSYPSYKSLLFNGLKNELRFWDNILKKDPGIQ